MFLPSRLAPLHIEKRQHFHENPDKVISKKVEFIGKNGVRVSALLSISQTWSIRGERYDVATFRELL